MDSPEEANCGAWFNMAPHDQKGPHEETRIWVKTDDVMKFQSKLERRKEMHAKEKMSNMPQMQICNDPTSKSGLTTTLHVGETWALCGIKQLV